MNITRNEIMQNSLKAFRFERPDFIPVTLGIGEVSWKYYPYDELWEIVEEFLPMFTWLDDDIKYGYMPEILPIQRREPYADSFGCVWQSGVEGCIGTVTGHPLKSWDDFKTWKRPDPNVCDGWFPKDWDAAAKSIKEAKARGEVVRCDLRHGFDFLRLCDLRGYENLMFDMMDEEPKLDELIEFIEAFNMNLVKRIVACKPDIMGYPEDLGMQVGPMITPDHFRRYIKPSYQRLMKPAKDAGALIHVHSDGDLRALMDDVIDCGVDIMEIQDLVNGIDWIAEKLGGKTAVDLDIDRQNLTVFGTAKEIDDHIRYAFEKISTRDGGFAAHYFIYPPVPLENVRNIIQSMLRYSTLYD